MSAKIVVGLGFGDEGKGTVTDALVANSSRNPLVVRFSGGAQAAHNVITENGVHHTFSQFGSGTLRSAATLLSKHVLVDPLRLYTEGLALNELIGRNALELVAVDERAPLVTRIHQAVNHVRERARGDSRHGSCGLGMGETEFYKLHNADYPTIGDLQTPKALERKLKKLHAWAEDQVGDLGIPLEDVFAELEAFGADNHLHILKAHQTNAVICAEPELIFEGSQGVLLDEWVGFHPHTTWSTVTPTNALSIIEEAGATHAVERIGVTRTYTTRHGAGPLPTESNMLNYTEEHNGYGEFQGAWRVGNLDLTLLAYSASVMRPHSIAITHMDVEQISVTERYDELFEFQENINHAEDKAWQEAFTRKLDMFTPKLRAVEGNRTVQKLIEDATNAKANLLSYGASASEKHFVKR